MAAPPTTPLDVRQDTARDAFRLGPPVRVAQYGVRLQEQLEVAQVAMTERMVMAEALGQRRCQSGGNLGAGGGVVEVRQRPQPGQADAGSTVAPRRHAG